jgi:hypothetical protein
MSLESLIRRIRDVFPIAQIPSKDAILYKGAYANDEELEEIKSFFENRTWQSITPIEIFRFRHALSFFSPTALVYLYARMVNQLLTR